MAALQQRSIAVRPRSRTLRIQRDQANGPKHAHEPATSFEMTFHTARNGEATGVWQLSDLQAAVGSGRVLPTDLIWTEGLRDWRLLHEVAKEIGIALPEAEETAPPIPVADEEVPHTPGIELQSDSSTHTSQHAKAPAVQPKVRPARGFPWLRLTLGLVCVAIILSIVAAIALPAYRNYRERPAAEFHSDESNDESTAPSSEQATAASTESDTPEQKFGDSGSSECIDISRRWAEARRKVDALEGTPAGGFATIELARIENVERVFAGCKGSESREEQEYVLQHPEELASRMREERLKAEAEAASAPKPERERVFAELISTWGVAGAGWGESSFVVKAKSTVQDPVRQLYPKLMRLAESVGMGITLEYSNESGEANSTNCPTQAEQRELDAQKAIEDEQRVIAEREARDQKRREDDCASLKAEYDSRVRSVVEESKGRNSPAPRLKQLEELYGDSLRSCANDPL